MTAKNDITGDVIKSKTGGKEYETGFDAIDWSVRLVEPDLSADTSSKTESVHGARTENKTEQLGNS